MESRKVSTSISDRLNRKNSVWLFFMWESTWDRWVWADSKVIKSKKSLTSLFIRTGLYFRGNFCALTSRDGELNISPMCSAQSWVQLFRGNLIRLDQILKRNEKERKKGILKWNIDSANSFGFDLDQTFNLFTLHFTGQWFLLNYFCIIFIIIPLPLHLPESNAKVKFLVCT